MSKVIKTNDGYYALLDAVYFAGFRLGNLSEEGLDWGGEKAQKMNIYSAQVRTGPVKVLLTRGGTNIITGKMIELLPDNCVALMGGSKNAETNGWDAPAHPVAVEGTMKILCGTGQTVEIHRASLTPADMRGGLGGDKTLGFEFEFEMLPTLDMSSPYSLYPTKPFIEADPATLTFPKAGGSMPVNIEASGPFAAGKVPDGFSIEVVNGRVTVIASENSGSERTGELVFTLRDDPSKTVKVTLSQSA